MLLTLKKSITLDDEGNSSLWACVRTNASRRSFVIDDRNALMVRPILKKKHSASAVDTDKIASFWRSLWTIGNGLASQAFKEPIAVLSLIVLQHCAPHFTFCLEIHQGYSIYFIIIIIIKQRAELETTRKKALPVGGLIIHTQTNVHMQTPATSSTAEEKTKK